MTTISIRRALSDEAGTLTQIAIAAKAHWNYPDLWMQIWTPQLTFTSEYLEKNESWVAVDGNQLTGFYTLLDNYGIAWIDNLWVLPAYMGKGVGRQLFNHAIEQARQRGFKTLQLEADPNALGFYEKMGMRKVGERQSEVDGQPRILPIMEMTL